MEKNKEADDLREEEVTEEESTQENVNDAENKYSDSDLSDEELAAITELQTSFNTFLQSDFDIVSEDDEIKATIPTGIDVLDTILGGGFATAFVMIVGMPGTAKTTLACKALANGQRLWPGQFVAGFADAEEITTQERLSQLGVNRPKITPITDISVEKVFKIVEALCNFKDQNKKLEEVPFALVWDSIANTLTEKGLVEEDLNKVMGEKARQLSHLLPKYVKKLNKYRMSLIAINQLRDKIDIGNVPKAPDIKWLHDKKVPGGKACLFNAAQLLFLKSSHDLKDTEFPFSGFKVNVQAVKNKLFRPHVEVTLIFSFERGFSNFWTNWELLKTKKKVTVAAWCSLPDYPEKKFRQRDAGKMYAEDEKFREIFDQYVEETIHEEFISKSSLDNIGAF